MQKDTPNDLHMLSTLFTGIPGVTLGKFILSTIIDLGQPVIKNTIIPL